MRLMSVRTTEGSAGCAPSPHFGAVLAVVILLLLIAVCVLAGSYPFNPRLRIANLGRGLIGLSFVLWMTSSLILQKAHRDRCGDISSSLGHWVNLLFGAGVAGTFVGLAFLTAAEWAPMLLIVVFDASMVSRAWLNEYGDRDRSTALLFGTHGVCIAVASWWSWRARGRGPSARAKASEAGRLLAGGLAAVGILQLASSGQSSTAPLFTYSNLGTGLIVAALTVALGTGYTKYVEAMETPLVGPQPRSSLPATLQRGLAEAMRNYDNARRFADRIYRFLGGR